MKKIFGKIESVKYIKNELRSSRKDEDLEVICSKIINEVEKNKDRAVSHFNKEFDNSIREFELTSEEIEIALDAIYSSSKQKEVYILHCVSNYPTDAKDVNLSCIKEMQNKFNLPIGFSDHTEGNAVSIAAVASGALLIEKHFTLDRSWKGTDHSFSLEPQGHPLADAAEAPAPIDHPPRLAR